MEFLSATLRNLFTNSDDVTTGDYHHTSRMLLPHGMKRWLQKMEFTSVSFHSCFVSWSRYGSTYDERIPVWI